MAYPAVEERNHWMTHHLEGPAEVAGGGTIHRAHTHRYPGRLERHGQLEELRHHRLAVRAPVNVELQEPELLPAARCEGSEQRHVQVDNRKVLRSLVVRNRFVGEELGREAELGGVVPGALLRGSEV